MIKFKELSLITALIALILCITLLFIPEVIFGLFKIQEHDSAFFIGRRTAMLFLGISIFAWVGRNALHSDSRQAISLGMAISMMALALLGVLEYFRGFAGLGISLAIVTEIALGAAYLNVWVNNKNA